MRHAHVLHPDPRAMAWLRLAGVVLFTLAALAALIAILFWAQPQEAQPLLIAAA
ncbi:MAG: hypothetical protein ACPL7M_14340 [Bryobacteraceae bacterium]